MGWESFGVVRFDLGPAGKGPVGRVPIEQSSCG